MLRRQRSQAAGFVAAAAFVMVSAVGCGSSDSQASQTAPAAEAAQTALQTITVATAAPDVDPGLPHAQLVKRMDRICGVYNAAIDRGNAKVQELQDGGDSAAAIAYARRTFDRLDRQFSADIHGLRPSAADRAAFNRYDSSVKRQNAYYVRLREAAAAGDAAAQDQMTDLINANAKKRIQAAVDLGLRRCGTP